MECAECGGGADRCPLASPRGYGARIGSGVATPPVAGAEGDLRWGLLHEVAGETVLLWDDRQAAAAETEIYWQLIGRITHWLEIYWNTGGAAPETVRGRTLFLKEDSRVVTTGIDTRILAVPPDNRTVIVLPTRTIN